LVITNQNVVFLTHVFSPIGAENSRIPDYSLCPVAKKPAQA